MSLIRYGMPLKFFKGNSTAYVFNHEGAPDEHGDNEPVCYIEDYDNKYDDKPTLVDLIGRIVEHETDDPKYALKIVTVLAKHLNIKDKMRDKPLTQTKEYEALFTKSTNDKSYRDFLNSIKYKEKK